MRVCVRGHVCLCVCVCVRVRAHACTCALGVCGFARVAGGWACAHDLHVPVDTGSESLAVVHVASMYVLSVTEVGLTAVNLTEVLSLGRHQFGATYATFTAVVLWGASNPGQLVPVCRAAWSTYDQSELADQSVLDGTNMWLCVWAGLNSWLHALPEQNPMHGRLCGGKGCATRAGLPGPSM